MESGIPSPLASWEAFYVISGSASAVLMGLQFVVVVLSAELNALGSGSATGAFATPTIVHFCAVLALAAVLSAPWPSLVGAAFALGVCGVAGLLYALVVVQRTRRQTDYEPVLEDWIWHAAFPVTAYAALAIAALLLASQSLLALFITAGATVLLLFIGIHNSWDAVVYIALRNRRQTEAPKDEPRGP